MAVINASYKLKDSTFDVNLLSQYNLYLHVGHNDLNIAIFDTQHNKCLLFENYDFKDTSADITMLFCMKSLWENHRLLNAGLWHKVVLLVCNTDFVFIPTEHYSEDSALHYLMLNASPDLQRSVLGIIPHPNLSTVCHFASPREIVRWLNDRYADNGLQCVHFNSCFLQGLVENKETSDDQLSLLVHPELISIAKFSDEKLVFINTFPYNTHQDILYFVLFVMGEIGMAPEKSKLKIWGTANNLDSCQALLKQYVKEVSLGERPRLFFGEGMYELAQHQAFDLFSAYYLLR